MNKDGFLHPLACRDENATRDGTIEPDPNRDNFARDRDRILYSRCFRRLAHKTQVYLTSERKEHARMRLTHTLEVSQVARTLARALAMNEDLVEAISLGHDVGHAPFGHAGEQQIQRYLSGQHHPPRHMVQRLDGKIRGIPRGDFKHNFQSVRLLSTLERYDTGGGGLNLTIQCLEGVLKHTKIAPSGQDVQSYNYPDNSGLFARLLASKTHGTIESQIVAIADEISQVAHDLADAILYQQLSFTELLLNKDISEVAQNTPKGRNMLAFFEKNPKSTSTLASLLASTLITYFVDACNRAARRQLDDWQQGSPIPVLWPKHVPDPVAQFSSLKEFKDKLVVNCHDVNRMDNKGMFVLRQLIDAYTSDPRQLQDAAFDRYRASIRDFNVNEKFTELSRCLPDHLQFGSEEQSGFTAALAERDACPLRQLKPQVLDKLPYYLLFDADWRRTIADQVSMMTDSKAMAEFQHLYGA